MEEMVNSSKMGSVRKCPACGELIPNGVQVCPACGYAFNETLDNGKCAQKLQEELLSIDREYKNTIAEALRADNDMAVNEAKRACAVAKNSAIMNTLIGNTRGELLELLAYSQPKAKLNGNKNGYVKDSYGDFKAEDFSFAYWTLFNNCLNQARQCFVNDSAFVPYFKFYNSQIEAENKRKKNKKLAMIVVAALVAVAVIIGLVISVSRAHSPYRNDGVCTQKVGEAIKAGNLEKAQDYVLNYKGAIHYIAGAATNLVGALAEAGDVEAAKVVAGKFHIDKTVKVPLYNYFLDKGMYDEAENYCEGDVDKNKGYYMYLSDCVNAMCLKGEISEAKKFVKRKVTYFPTSSKYEYNQKEALRKLNAIIDSF